MNNSLRPATYKDVRVSPNVMAKTISEPVALFGR